MSDRLPFELRIPGTWLALSDRDASWSIQTQLQFVQSAFDEAVMAFILFERSLRDARWSRETMEEYSRRRSEIERSLEIEEDGEDFDMEAYDKRRVEVDAIVLRKLYEEGVIPRQLQHHVPFIYAKAFLYAADSIGKILARLSEDERIPEESRAICRDFYNSFPELREVRNSAQHIEDRGRGLGKGGKPLDLKPINNSLLKADGGGVLALNNLNGNRYGSVMADGHYGEVEISGESVATIRDVIEGLLHSLPWTGSPENRPSR